ncbi:MAG: MFS transporter [Candidatus Kariarchaeaceae archaeon]
MNTKIFTSLTVFSIMANFRRGLFYTFLFYYVKNFLGVSVTTSTLIATLPMFASALAQPFVWGRLSDKFQKRRIFIFWGEISGAIGYALIWYFHRVVGETSHLGAAWVIIIGMTITEFFWSASNVNWAVFISDLTKSDERTKVMGRLNAIGQAGGITGIIIPAYLYTFNGLRGGGFWYGPLFILPALIMIGGAFVIQFGTPETTPENNHLFPGRRNHILKSESTDENTESPTIRIDFKILYWFLLGLAIANIGRNGSSMTIIYYITEGVFKATDGELSIFSLARRLAAIPAGFTVEILARKMGTRKTFYLGIIIGAIALGGFWMAPSLTIIYMMNFLIGISMVYVTTTAYAIFSVIVPEEVRGKYFGFYNVAFFLSWGTCSTLITGPLADSLIGTGVPAPEAYLVTFIVSIAIVIAGLWILFIMPYLPEPEDVIDEKKIPLD